MSNQFTQGPWRTFGGMVDGYGIMASDRTIVITQEAFNGLNHRANARLIAAAPALYEALSELRSRTLEHFKDLHGAHGSHEMARALDSTEAALALVENGDSQ